VALQLGEVVVAAKVYGNRASDLGISPGDVVATVYAFEHTAAVRYRGSECAVRDA
jgi:hypothetical protein